MSDYPRIPTSMLPVDGRFGSGPSKIRPQQLQALTQSGRNLLGTSHRQAAVKDLVGQIRSGLLEFFAAPSGYRVILGNGGATSFWDVATCCLVEQQALHLSFGEFGSKFAKATSQAPFLQESLVIQAPAGRRPELVSQAGVDFYAWPHNETSTGVSAPVQRPQDSDDGALVVIDGTSAAGGLEVDISQTGVYYFSPQKNFGSDGGLWLALFSESACQRAEGIAASGRWIPDSLNLLTAIENSKKNQTYNTPALATLLLLDQQITWLNEQGGMAFAAQRTAQSSQQVYQWAEKVDYAEPFVKQAADRSAVICTIDFAPEVDAARLAQALRANGILDTEPYRKLGRNQLRIATFTSIDPADVQALLSCIDYLVTRL